MNKNPKNSPKKAGDALRETHATYRVSPPGDDHPLQTKEDKGWEDFREQCRRQMERPLSERIKHGFIRPINATGKKQKPRSFGTMAEYREWCEKNMPDYLGFKRRAK